MLFYHRSSMFPDKRHNALCITNGIHILIRQIKKHRYIPHRVISYIRQQKIYSMILIQRSLKLCRCAAAKRNHIYQFFRFEYRRIHLLCNLLCLPVFAFQFPLAFLYLIVFLLTFFSFCDILFAFLPEKVM